MMLYHIHLIFNCIAETQTFLIDSYILTHFEEENLFKRSKNSKYNLHFKFGYLQLNVSLNSS